MAERLGIKVTKQILNLCPQKEILFTRRESNLDGKSFERAVIQKFPSLHFFERPIPPQLQSFYSRGTTREVEPIVDCFYEGQNGRRMLVEIKKGFYIRNQMYYLGTSHEQLHAMRYGTTLVGGNGHSYLPGEYWVFVRHRMSSNSTRNVKFTWYRVPQRVVLYFFNKKEQLGIPL